MRSSKKEDNFSLCVLLCVTLLVWQLINPHSNFLFLKNEGLLMILEEMLLIELTVPDAVSAFLRSSVAVVDLALLNFYLWQTLQACQVSNRKS